MKKIFTMAFFLLSTSLLSSCNDTTTVVDDEYVFPVGYWNLLDYISQEQEYFDENGNLLSENITLGDYPFVLSDDNSVTYTVPKEVIDDMLLQLSMSMDEYMDYMETDYSTVQKITRNDEYTVFDMYFDETFSYALFNDFDVFLINSICYQIYKDVPSDELTATINIYDNDTQEKINTFTYENFFTNISFPSYLEENLSSDIDLFSEYAINYTIDETIDVTIPRTFSFFLGELYKYQLDNSQDTLTSLTNLENLKSVVVNDSYTKIDIYINSDSTNETMSITYPALYSSIYGYYVYNELPFDESNIIFNVYDSDTDNLIESKTFEELSPTIQSLSTATIN